MTRNGLGNKCGHNKAAPARYLHAKLGKRPKIIQQAKYRLYSVNDTSLGYRNYFESLKKYRFITRKTCRQVRSESREALTIVGAALLDFVDLETMALGKWESNGEFRARTYQEIYKALCEAIPEENGYSERRFWRHIRVLKDSRYIRSKRRAYKTGKLKDDGSPEIREDVSVKFVTKRFFYEMGFTPEQLEDAREISRKRNLKTRPPMTDALKRAMLLKTPGKTHKWYKEQQQIEQAASHPQTTKAQRTRNIAEENRKKEIREQAVRSWNAKVYELSERGLTLSEVKARIGEKPI